MSPGSEADASVEPAEGAGPPEPEADLDHAHLDENLPLDPESVGQDVDEFPTE